MNNLDYYDSRILVVDDDVDILNSTARILRKEGYINVESASSGLKGLEKAENFIPDLMLLDYSMPDINGFELCRKVKSHPKISSAIVIMVSGTLTSSESQAEGLDIGADGYITRPFEKREFLARIKAMLRIKAAEYELMKEKQFSDNLINSMTDTFYLFDPENGEGVRWNRMLEEISGYDYNEMKDKPPAAFYPPEEQPFIEKVLKEVKDDGKGTVELSYITRDGSHIPFEYAVSSITGPDGRKLLCSIGRNITERKKMENQLRLERDKAQSYLDIARIMIVAIDRDGYITMINQKGCQILGYGESELIGKNWFDTCIPERLRQVVMNVSRDILAGNVESVEQFENSVLTKDGKERLILWHNSVIRNEAGEVTGHLSSGEDITEKKRAEKALRDSEENMRDLVYVASHDLQTPIISLVGYSSKILEQYADNLDSEGVFALQRLKKNAEKMHDLVVKLLDLSRLNTVRLNLKKVNTENIVKSVLMDLDLNIKENNVQVTISDLPVVNADSDRLTTIFRNLISNAVIYGGKSVDISCVNMVFMVKDDGIGISHRNLEKIFRPGERIKKIDAEGTGMGLAICRKIITKHDGRIWAESDGEGMGATLKFELDGQYYLEKK